MRVVPKTEFSDMSGVDLATTDEVLQIVIHKTVIGYFVPPDVWQAQRGPDIELVILADVLSTIEDGDPIAPERVATWRELAGLGEG